MGARRAGGPPGGTLSARIMDTLGRRIVAGGYRVGDALPPEPALCGEYGVSRTPLREAVKRLHAKGLVAVGPRSGTRVLPQDAWNLFDPDVLGWRFAAGADRTLIGQLYELRTAFEPEACRLAAIHGGPEDHAAIAAGFARMEALQADPLGIVAADIDFHVSIIAATRNPFMVGVGAAVRMVLAFSFNLRTEHTRFPEAELDQHRIIAEAILGRRGEPAADAMRALLAQSLRTLSRALARRDETRDRTHLLTRNAAR